jgi:hypothetical protein
MVREKLCTQPQKPGRTLYLSAQLAWAQSPLNFLLVFGHRFVAFRYGFVALSLDLTRAQIAG